MAINFDVSKCVDFQTHFPDESNGNGHMRWNTLFSQLSMVMLIIGGPDPKNMEEFWRRVDLYQKKVHPLAHKLRRTEDAEPEPVYLTREQVFCLANMRVNIGPLSKREFEKRFMKLLREPF